MDLTLGLGIKQTWEHSQLERQKGNTKQTQESKQTRRRGRLDMKCGMQGRNSNKTKD